MGDCCSPEGSAICSVVAIALTLRGIGWVVGCAIGSQWGTHVWVVGLAALGGSLVKGPLGSVPCLVVGSVGRVTSLVESPLGRVSSLVVSVGGLV